MMRAAMQSALTPVGIELLFVISTNGSIPEVQCAVHIGGPVQGLQRCLQALLPAPPARIFFCVPERTGSFDVEVDCVAVTKD